MTEKLHRSLDRRIETDQSRLAQLSRMLHSLSPLPTMARGFAIVKDAQNNVQTSVKQLSKGEQIRAQFTDGTLEATITEITNETIGESSS